MMDREKINDRINKIMRINKKKNEIMMRINDENK